MNWLTNEAISNYIVFVLGVAAGILAEIIRSYLRKRRVSIVRVEREKSSSLLSLSPEARKRIKITYARGKETTQIDELWQTTFRIFNRGDKPISTIEVGIILEGDVYSYLLETIVEDHLLYNERKSRVDLRYTKDGQLMLWVQTDFLNPAGMHNDEIKLEVYSSEPLQIRQVLGGGMGWSVRYFDRVAFDEETKRFVQRSLAKIFLTAIPFSEKVLFLPKREN